MKNRGLGTHNEKIFADISTGNTPQFIWPICPNLPIIWVIFEKKTSHHMSIVYASNFLFYVNVVAEQGKIVFEG